jgi:hypothetical protein
MARIKWHMRGFVQLRNAPGVVADLQARAQRIAEAAGEGVATRPAETHYGRQGRARAAVVTETYDAMRSQAKDSTLSRAIDAGR